MKDCKIFGIGLSKTGTTSLARALEILGYRTKDYPGIKRFLAGDLASLDLDEIDMYEALTDTPIPSFYKELDESYPGSKFILTVRDQQGWLKSCKKQFTKAHSEQQNTASREVLDDLYGTSIYDEVKFAAGYRRFVDNVHEYFKDRPDDLLVMDVAAGDGWEKLCPFLGQTKPGVTFPKANVTDITWIKIEDVVRVASKAGDGLLRVEATTKRRNPLRNAMYKMRGGDAGMIERAAWRTCRIIMDGLTALSPNIPVVSRVSGNVPFSARSGWNHFWLVDPLDGTGSFLQGEDSFTINIALIQDGLPIYGVVYAPRLGLSYFSRLGKGAFRTDGGATEELMAVEFTDIGNPDPKRVTNVTATAQDSIALNICRAVENETEILNIERTVHEYESAAAQLIATSAGMTVSEYGCDRGSSDGKSLTYNKPEMASDSLFVSRRKNIS